MTTYTTLSDLMERYEIVASKPHYAIFWNGSRTFKLYHLLDSGRCIELTVNSTMEECSLPQAIIHGNDLIEMHFADERTI